MSAVENINKIVDVYRLDDNPHVEDMLSIGRNRRANIEVSRDNETISYHIGKTVARSLDMLFDLKGRGFNR